MLLVGAVWAAGTPCSRDVEFVFQTLDRLHPGAERLTEDSRREYTTRALAVGEEQACALLLGEVAAQLRDGHTEVWPVNRPPTPSVPVRIDAHGAILSSPVPEWGGATLWAVDGEPIEELLRQVEASVPRETEGYVESHVPSTFWSWWNWAHPSEGSWRFTARLPDGSTQERTLDAPKSWPSVLDPDVGYAEDCGLEEAEGYDGLIVCSIHTPTEGLKVGDHVRSMDGSNGLLELTLGDGRRLELPARGSRPSMSWIDRGELLVLRVDTFDGREGGWAWSMLLVELEGALEGKRTVILDLRGNGGGQTQRAEGVARALIGWEETLGSTFNKWPEVRRRMGMGRLRWAWLGRGVGPGEALVDSPRRPKSKRDGEGVERVVVLVDGFSYSASASLARLLLRRGREVEVLGAPIGGTACPFGNTIDRLSPSGHFVLTTATVASFFQDEADCQAVSITPYSGGLRALVQRELARLRG